MRSLKDEFLADEIRARLAEHDAKAEKMRLARRKSWAKNLEENRTNLREKHRAIKSAVVDALGGTCHDCGGKFHPACFDFDHIEPSEKSANVSQLCGSSFDRAMQEAAKCELVCANCHRIRTTKSEKVSSKIRSSRRSSHLAGKGGAA